MGRLKRPNVEKSKRQDIELGMRASARTGKVAQHAAATVRAAAVMRRNGFSGIESAGRIQWNRIGETESSAFRVMTDPARKGSRRWSPYGRGDEPFCNYLLGASRRERRVNDGGQCPPNAQSVSSSEATPWCVEDAPYVLLGLRQHTRSLTVAALISTFRRFDVATFRRFIPSSTDPASQSPSRATKCCSPA
ncbi:hypothetical protein RAS2_20920 [Phycisphaerae bacterium RAS2]|nr:hypothetical protein RAS2_20920 [Phycisphaerae bacterium RAS2]